MDVLVAIVDLNAVQWGKRSAAHAAATAAAASTSDGSAPAASAAPPVLTITSFVDQLLVFFNAFLVLNKANQLCVIAVDSQHADFVWPREMAATRLQAASSAPAAQDAHADEQHGRGTKRKSHKDAASAGAAAAAAASTAAVPASSSSALDAAGVGVNDDLLRQLHAFAASGAATAAASSAADGGATAESGSKLAGALSLGLCYLNRVHTAAAANPSGIKLRSRMLLFSVCPDQSSQYISIMNCIFSTQKQSIPVDSCVLGESDSLFLQQASHLTKGIYGRVPTQHQHALLQYLLAQVDLRATCYCHQQVVQLAVVCPACLTLLCRSQPQCPVCKTRFAVLNQATAAGGAGAAARPQTPQQAAPAVAR